jgi:hypothetical protein
VAEFRRFAVFPGDVAAGLHEAPLLLGGTFEAYLSLADPDPGMAETSELPGVAAGNGYAGLASAETTADLAADGAILVHAPGMTVAASGGPIATFRYVVMCHAGRLVAWWDYGLPLTLADGESLAVSFGDPVLRVG